ncbi:MAG: hypothetical protein CMG74_06070 [Candidatus Marinimicrobia bacterium]|nr:hypothetical protein [Candidatus Neomarinimicrobiota bacterium]
MIRLPVIIRYYLLYFLMIDFISGFTRVYLGIISPLANIGYWVRGPLLLLFIFYYVYQLYLKKLYLDETLCIILFIYLVINIIINYSPNFSHRIITDDFPYILRFQFLLFLFVYMKNRMKIDKDLVSKIIKNNFFIFTISLLLGYIFNFGMQSYRLEGTSKGMFQGGNDVSILNLIFFTYFILNGKFRRYFIPSIFTIFNGYIIASKSIVGFIIPLFFALKKNILQINKFIFITVLCLVIGISLEIIIDSTVKQYEKRFGLNIKKSLSAAEKVGGLYNNKTMNRVASINFRRYASLNAQMSESLSSLRNFLFGFSHSGQVIFWEKRGEFTFPNASMDFFDFFFKYGLIGIVILSIILLKDFKNIIKKCSTRDFFIILFFFGYAFFGGHVIASTTSGTLFYFYNAYVSKRNVFHSENIKL